MDSEGRPTAFRPVGYPAALAAVFAFAGPGLAASVALQVVLGVATCVLISQIGTVAFGPRVGGLAGLLLAAYPTHVAYSTLHLSEPLFALLMVLCVPLLLRAGVSLRAAVAAGLVLGLAGLVRPMFLPFPLAVYFALRAHAPDRRARLVRTVLIGAVSMSVVLPWALRNGREVGRWAPSTSGGQAFWAGNQPGALGGYAAARDITAQIPGTSMVDHSAGYGLGVAAIAEAPLDALVRAVFKISYTFALETDGVLWNLKGLPTMPPLGTTLALLAVANLAYVVLLGFAVLGTLTTSHPLRGLFVTLAAFVAVMSAIFHGDPRFHHALVPFATVFAAKGMLHDWSAARRPAEARLKRRWLAIWAAFVALMILNLALKAIEIQQRPAEPTAVLAPLGLTPGRQTAI